MINTRMPYICLTHIATLLPGIESPFFRRQVKSERSVFTEMPLQYIDAQIRSEHQDILRHMMAISIFPVRFLAFTLISSNCLVGGLSSVLIKAAIWVTGGFANAGFAGHREGS